MGAKEREQCLLHLPNGAPHRGRLPAFTRRQANACHESSCCNRCDTSSVILLPRGEDKRLLRAG